METVLVETIGDLDKNFIRHFHQAKNAAAFRCNYFIDREKSIAYTIEERLLSGGILKLIRYSNFNNTGYVY